MHARPIRSSLGPDPNGSALVCTGPNARVFYKNIELRRGLVMSLTFLLRKLKMFLISLF